MKENWFTPEDWLVNKTEVLHHVMKETEDDVDLGVDKSDVSFFTSLSISPFLQFFPYINTVT